MTQDAATLSPTVSNAVDTFRRVLLAERKVEREKRALQVALARCKPEDQAAYVTATTALIEQYEEQS